MHGTRSNILAISASFPTAENCQQRQDSADPLWFGVMCRAIWGANAAKELQFVTKKSDRTCRAWVSGDSEPPASVLRALERDEEYGPAFRDYVMRDCHAHSWAEDAFALKVGRAALAAVRGP